MTQLDPQLDALGDRLEQAAAADLATQRAAGRAARRVASRGALLLVAAVLAIAIPGVAIAADQLISTERGRAEHARRHAGAGRHRADLHRRHEGRRVPLRARQGARGDPRYSDWKGTVEPSVDASKHVNGGCRSLASDGREWQCYIGQAAVDQKIIGQGFLGEFAPAPGQG